MQNNPPGLNDPTYIPQPYPPPPQYTQYPQTPYPPPPMMQPPPKKRRLWLWFISICERLEGEVEQTTRAELIRLMVNSAVQLATGSLSKEEA